MEKPQSASQRLQTALARVRSPEFEGEKAFVELFIESAEREAREADQRIEDGLCRGPLDGRLVSIKALFDIAGKTTRAGSDVLRALAPATDDSVVVKNLRAGGAVITGWTQMTEFAFSTLGTNPHDGTPGNSRDRARAPGGSSSGAVVSVVDRMAEIAIGSDTGGSARIPASLSGAVGFKPTSGRISTAGAFSLSSTLDTIGPIALSVADCAAADSVMSGRTSGEPVHMASPDSFRLIVAQGRLFDNCEPEVIDAFESAVGRLKSSDVQIESGSIEKVLDRIAQVDKIGTFPSIEVAATLRGLGVSNLDGVDQETRKRIEGGLEVSAVDYVRMVRLRNAAIGFFESTFSDNEVFILPTTPIRAPLLSSIKESLSFHEINGLLLRNPRIANLLDCPSISLPLPVEGLPIGLMLIGRRNSDRRLLEIASRIEMILNPATTSGLA